LDILSEEHKVSYLDLGDLLPSEIFAGLNRPVQGPVRNHKELLRLIDDLCLRVMKLIHSRETPLVIGGDHSIVVGSIAAALRSTSSLGLVWVDAHYDAHTAETSHTGNAHGMPLATVLGFGGRCYDAVLQGRSVDPRHVLHVGAGSDDCEPEELELLDRLEVARFSDATLREIGWEPVFSFIEKLASSVEKIWVSFDLDAVRAEDAPGVYYRRKNGGLSRKEVLQLAYRLSATRKVVGADIVEMNFLRERVVNGRFVTAVLASEFAELLFS
jgi:arginase